MLKRINSSVAFTIVANNRLPSAIICRESFLKHNPGVDFVIFLADRAMNNNDVAAYKEAQPIINCYELKQIPFFRDSNSLEELAYKYDIIEFCTAIKPSCIQYLMWNGYDKVCYFDPDIMFFDSIENIYKALGEYECVLTPHITNPIPDDGKIPNNTSILIVGPYNLGFGGWSLSQRTIDFLCWWQKQLKHFGFSEISHNMFVDQLWMGYAPSFLNTYVIKHPGYNAAYWNLHERNYILKNNKWYVNDTTTPLIFYHYSGINYEDTSVISKYQDRYKIEDRIDLASIFNVYMRELNKVDAIITAHKPYYFDTAPSGKKLSKEIKRDYVPVLQENVNPWLVTQGCKYDYGVNIAGYFPYISGMAKMARDFTKKMYSTGIPYTLTPIACTHKHIDLDEEREFGIYYTNNSGFKTTILFANLDQLAVLTQFYPALFDYNTICVPMWELEEDLPYSDNMQYIDTIVAFSQYTYDIFSKYAYTYRLPYPVNFPKQGDYESNPVAFKQRLGVEPDDFLFYYSFDYCSSYERKNPHAIIEAFQKACAGRPKTKLVIKTLHANRYPTENNNLILACRELGVEDQIRIFDGDLSEKDTWSFIDCADCYISLHRSEGVGIAMLQSMMLGKPVIATGYGGNMEFMDSCNAMLVTYDKVTLEKDAFNGIYRKGGIWAEPHIDSAASHIEKIVTDKEFREDLGRQARVDMIHYANMSNFNNSIYDLLSKEIK